MEVGLHRRRLPEQRCAAATAAAPASGWRWTTVAQISPKLLAAAAWGPLGPAIALAPGGEAIVTSPPIGKGQREASVTVSSSAAGQTTVATGVPTDPRTDKPIKRGDCVLGATYLFLKTP